MASRSIVVHPQFSAPAPERRPAGRAALAALRAERRTALGTPTWERRRFPVLAALAPVMTSTEGEITYPGDPMCLYAALSVVVDSALRSRHPDPDAPFPDLCPDWGERPTKHYRLTAEHGPRPWHEDDSNTDHTVFDPRVWDDEARDRLRSELRRRRPRVFLVSTVSPGHRYALEMAGLVREEVPDCLVVMGGRHIDETMRWLPNGGLSLQYSSTLRAIEEGRAGPVVDFLCAGEGYFLLELLLRAIALAMPVDRRAPTVQQVLTALDLLGEAEEPVPGSALLCALTPEAVHAVPVRGPKFDLADLPSPYQGFAVRARFPVFPLADGSAARTAHLTVSNACPYHCDFCSEAAPLAGGLKRFEKDPALAGLERVCEYVGYGAEAGFFDDSIFWSGNFPRIREFCALLAAARADPDSLPERCARWLPDEDDRRRLRGFRFGCQVTADLMTALHKEDEVRELLAGMRAAGCAYVYLGIESMSSAVMAGVHKNLRRDEAFPWKAKVRTALERIRDAGIPVGSSVLFGLDGETRETIEETVEEVGRLIDDDLLTLASPNILTYHPATAITRMHGMTEELDYHSPTVANRAPYIYFEEAFPGVVSRTLSEDDIWFIHRSTAVRWGVQRNAEAAEAHAAPAVAV